MGNGHIDYSHMGNGHIDTGHMDSDHINKGRNMENHANCMTYRGVDDYHTCPSFATR